MSDEEQTNSSFKIGMEVPTKYLSWFAPFQDYLLCSALELQTNAMYTAWHLRESIAKNRVVVVGDLSYKTGIHLPVSELIELAFMCAATIVIGPSYSLNKEKTVLETNKLLHDIQGELPIMGVVEGITLEEKIACFEEYEGAAFVGFPRTSRLELLRALTDKKLLDRSTTYSLLGFHSFQELSQIAALGSWEWMVNIGEPIQLALQNKDIEENLISNEESKYKLKDLLTDHQLYQATENIIAFKNFLPETNDSTDEEDD